MGIERSLDDVKSPMMQMIIFTFNDGSQEVLFGHEFPTMRHGPSYKTRNSEVIKFFDAYFEHWFQLGADEPSHQETKIP